MVTPWTSALPEWLIAGLGLGGLTAALIAALFLLGVRTFPAPNGDTDTGRAERDGGESRRRREIRRYLRSIGEPFVEDRRVAGHDVAFFLPEREVAVTFDPHGYFRLERAGVHAILVEHELPGAGIGHRLPFETPDVESVPDRAGEAFAALGLPADASPAEVREAYRTRVKAAHPDHGGDAEAFERVRQAYTVAKRHAESATHR